MCSVYYRMRLIFLDTVIQPQERNRDRGRLHVCQDGGGNLGRCFLPVTVGTQAQITCNPYECSSHSHGLIQPNLGHIPPSWKDSGLGVVRLIFVPGFLGFRYQPLGT